jgi:dTDP-glucose 4,6-dehydratase
MAIKVLITGIAGFIPSNLAHYIVDNYPDLEVVGIDKLTYAGDKDNIPDGVTWYKRDICDYEHMEFVFNKEKPDVVIHAAAESMVDRSIEDSAPFITTNVLGTQVMLDVSRKHNIEKFVMFSTDEVYGQFPRVTKRKTGYKEDMPMAPRNPYAASKAAADLLCQSYITTHNMPIIIVRPSNNYGPRQNKEKLIPKIIHNLDNDIKIPIYGAGQNIREWLYVEDTCKAVMSILKCGKRGEAYNVGSKWNKTNILVVKEIIESMKGSDASYKDYIKYVEDRKAHDYRYWIDEEKIKEDTGWESETSFKEGIAKTIEWYKK